ncbi:uncharacterized protein LOC128302941 [Anopheles moucheti]|uniref:uncharacterized protein LOC128302941 n=1 Tax=Anopheles moucheti TaxID=186751 RepID=UPI0022F0655B|nr:uncharacterized protein LOC128302941 [Anopheles moucheti]
MITRQQNKKRTVKADGKENRKPVAGRKASNIVPPAKKPVVKKVRNTTIATRIQKRQQEQQQRRSPRVASRNASSVESQLQFVHVTTTASNIFIKASSGLRMVMSLQRYHALINAKLDNFLKAIMEENWTPNTFGSWPCTCMYDVLALKRILVLWKTQLDELEDWLKQCLYSL